MLKKIMTITMTAVLAMSVAACTPQKAGLDAYDKLGEMPEDGYTQLNDPQKGDMVAIMETSMGTIKMRLFPQYAPKTVENFTTLAEQGYYDGIIFHRVQDNFMIQGGDPLGTGRGGESIWGMPFEDELTPQLHNIRGALSMANSGADMNGSQFFIVQRYDVPPDEVQIYRDMAEKEGEWFDGTPILGKDIRQEEFNQVYDTEGGVPYLDYRHTVFGQVYEGMDVVDAIAKVETVKGADGEQTKPAEDVVILSVTIGEYE